MAKKKVSKKKKSAPVKRAKTSTKARRSVREAESSHFPISNLHLDGGNPRLGPQAGQFKSEVEILDTVVNVFGIDDVLSSLAVNGYFEAEPLVGIRLKQHGHLRIAEGNRRLAACLILADDERARNHRKRTTEFQALQKRSSQSPISNVPVRVLSDDRTLLSYLGVRHIAAAQPWDSYAKAAWVANVLEEGELELEDVSDMIGDQHKTVARTLEGYYFVNQLIRAAQFNPTDSLRPGRGSNPEYPFSWIYTALGFGPIREWLDLADLGQRGRQKEPIQGADKLDEAAELLVFLFGNRGKGRQAAVSDSRQIAELAECIADRRRLSLLKQGYSTTEASELARPRSIRIQSAMTAAHDALNDASRMLRPSNVSGEVVQSLAALARRAKQIATIAD